MYQIRLNCDAGNFVLNLRWCRNAIIKHVTEIKGNINRNRNVLRITTRLQCLEYGVSAENWENRNRG